MSAVFARDVIPQGNYPWCWAASAGMALEYQTGKRIELCKVAAYVKGLEPRDCCSTWGAKKICNTTGSPENALKSLGMWGKGAYKINNIEGVLTPSITKKLKEAIQSKRPVLASLRRYDLFRKETTWHAVELRGINFVGEQTKSITFADSARVEVVRVGEKDLINLMTYGVLETLYVGTQFSGSQHILNRVQD